MDIFDRLGVEIPASKFGSTHYSQGEFRPEDHDGSSETYRIVHIEWIISNLKTLPFQNRSIQPFRCAICPIIKNEDLIDESAHYLGKLNFHVTSVTMVKFGDKSKVHKNILSILLPCQE